MFNQSLKDSIHEYYDVLFEYFSLAMDMTVAVGGRESKQMLRPVYWLIKEFRLNAARDSIEEWQNKLENGQVISAEDRLLIKEQKEAMGEDYDGE